MQVMNKNFETIDAYIANFPANQQAVLQQIRRTIKSAAPEACEKISYGIPTFFLKSNLVHFAAFKTHYGFYPGPDAIIQFKEDFAPYEQSKGAVHFPLNKPVPLALIRRVTEARVRENLVKAAQKMKKSLKV